MKITIFGLTLSSSWGNGHATPYRAIIRALHRMGHEVVFFEKDTNYYAARRDFSVCDFCQLILYADWGAVRNQALQVAAESDVVITASYLPDGALINDEVLALANPIHAFYDLDTPVTLNRLQASNLEYLRRDQIPKFDLYLSFTGGAILDQLKKYWHAKKVAPIYGCVDPDVHFRVDVPEQYRCALSYMGTYAADREQKLDELFFSPARQLSQEKFVLAGSMYPWNMNLPANVRHFEHVSPADHSALYSSSRLTLNLTRAEMAQYGYCPSGRLFEASACRTPIISDDWDGISDFFADGQEIIIVRSAHDVTNAMRRDDAELAVIAKRARERTLDQHTGMHRAQQILAAIEDCKSSAHSIGSEEEIKEAVTEEVAR